VREDGMNREILAIAIARLEAAGNVLAAKMLRGLLT